jgi:hypothetical protein
MNSRFVSGLALLLLLGAFAFSLQTGGPALAFVITLVAAAITLFNPVRPLFLRLPLKWLRGQAALYWLLILVYLCVGLGYWVVTQQPTHGKAITPAEWAYLCLIGWGVLFVLCYDMRTEDARALGSRLAQSKFTGVMVTLTTIVLIFWGVEGYLRRFYVTTDGYGFTAMNYWWYENFYRQSINSLGYRDFEPLPDDPGITRVAIVGDSFAAGHGIDNLNDTFPQRLEQRLGDGWDVNVIALSGMDTDVETDRLEGYYQGVAPRRPQYVVLSYYLNDIDYLLVDPSQNPDAVFSFLDEEEQPLLYHTVLNLFTANYLYYNLLQFTSPTRNTNFTDRLIRAHTDPALWAQHEVNLQAFYQWTLDHDAQMILLLWPQMAAIPQSQPALDSLRSFARERTIPVAEMSPVLEGYPTQQIILNRFDSHPSILANHLAADVLYATIEELREPTS